MSDIKKDNQNLCTSSDGKDACIGDVKKIDIDLSEESEESDSSCFTSGTESDSDLDKTCSDEDELYFSCYSDTEGFDDDDKKEFRNKEEEDEYKAMKRSEKRWDKYITYMESPDECKNDAYLAYIKSKRNKRDYSKYDISREDDKEESIADLHFILDTVKDQYRRHHNAKSSKYQVKKALRKDARRIARRNARKDTRKLARDDSKDVNSDIKKERN